MSIEPSLEDQELLEDTLRRGSSPMTRGEIVAGVVSGAAFVAAVCALWLASPPASFAPGAAVLCLAVLVLAMRVRFETPFGFTVPTQLAFVPLVFAMPPAVVPLAVAGAFVLAQVPEVLKRRVPPHRLLLQPTNAWFALGPAVVLAIAHAPPQTAGAGILIAALGAQFAMDSVGLAVHTVIARDVPLSSLVRSSWVYVIDAALSGIALVVAQDIHSAPLAALSLVPLLGLLAVFAHERRRRLESMLELSSAYRGTALVLGDVIEADDGYTGQHCKSVVTLCLELAEHLHLTPERQRNLEFAALLHDVGKIAIPKEIINKPGKLDPHEWTIIKTHTLEGQKMLDRVGGFMRQVGHIVRSHHERWDGTGYPDNLTGDQIPLEARIIACCDTWNAMRTNRAYRQALSYEVAVAELQSASGTQLDPKLVDVLLALVVNEAPETQTVHPGAAGAPRPQPAFG